MQGLRTLVVGTKIIPTADYHAWDQQYQAAAASFEGRDEKMDLLGNVIEDGLELIGVTAIEDKLQVRPMCDVCRWVVVLISIPHQCILTPGFVSSHLLIQDGVPDAIQTLLDASIRVWMITGDKQETAVNIAVSCSLVSAPDDVMMLNVDEKSESECGRRRGWG